MIDMDRFQVNKDLCSKRTSSVLFTYFDPWFKALRCETLTMQVLCQFTPHEAALKSVNLLSSSLRADTSEREALDKQANSMSNNQIQGLGSVYFV